MDYRDPHLRLHPFEPEKVAGDWDRTIIRALATDDPRIETVIEDLNASHVNGGTQFARFSVEAAPTVEWLISRNRWSEFNMFERFFGHPEVLRTFPELGEPNADIAGFTMESSFGGLGALASCISGGGAYERHRGTDESALALTTDFFRAICDMRLSETYTWVNWKPWTDWFFEVAWDGTFFWFDTRTGIVTVLMITDTD